jgi:hypothetical protein
VAQASDIVLTIKRDRVFLKSPEHEDDSPVPHDFLVALGISRAFYDPVFRRTMMKLAQNVINEGGVEGIEPHYDGPTH